MTLQARYTILRKIADGGTAEIFLATQHGAHGFEKPVVLKRIFPAFYADPQFRNMLVDEAHIAMSLNHSNIVQVLDLGEADGQYVLALELVDGWSLDAVLRRARALNTTIPPALALYTAAEVCRALAYAHAKTSSDDKPLGIVHRDASPHNVLLSEQGEVKLTDFGIAKAHNRRESSLGNMIKGKIAYMSPEQASGGELDARSDLFSVGTMLYVMICGRYPFDAPTDLEVLLLVKSGEHVPPETARPGLNPEIYRVLKRAMAKAPADRYQRAEEMLVDFEQVMRVAFRPVGQTELKRWLQDLSMRDGVLPLTRAAPVASSTSGIAGHHEGDVVELHGVGETPPPQLPPPTSSAHPKHPAPAVGSGPNKVRPPPPPAAMLVGKKSSSSTYAVPTLPAVPAARSAPTVNPPSTPLPAKIDDEPAALEQQTPVLLLPPGLVPPELAPPEEPPANPVEPQQMATIASEPASEPSKGEKIASSPVPESIPDDSAPEELTGSPRADRPSAGIAALDPPVHAPPRKSSSWVAEAVLASAQRAGTAPPPPVGPAVPAPPVTLPVPTAAATETPSVPTTTETTTRPKPRRAALSAVLGIAAVLVVGFSVKVCGGRSESSRQASLRRAKHAGQMVAVSGTSRDAAVTLATRASTTTGHADSSAAAAVTSAVDATGAGVHASVGIATVAENTPGQAMPGTGPGVMSSPGPTAPPIVVAAPEGSAGGDSTESDPDGGAEPEGTTARVPRVMVLLKSTPPGALVGTPRRSFGATPVSARLKVGRTYALTFTREGYRPVTKQFRVTNFSDQQVTAMLRKAAAAPAVVDQPPPQPATPKPGERNWFQRMFGR